MTNELFETADRTRTDHAEAAVVKIRENERVLQDLATTDLPVAKIARELLEIAAIDLDKSKEEAK